MTLITLEELLSENSATINRLTEETHAQARHTLQLATQLQEKHERVQAQAVIIAEQNLHILQLETELQLLRDAGGWQPVEDGRIADKDFINVDFPPFYVTVWGGWIGMDWLEVELPDGVRLCRNHG